MTKTNFSNIFYQLGRPVFYITFILTQFTFLHGYAQEKNLVPNGSFEEITQCYGDPALSGFDIFQWSGCTGWTCPTYGSSDLWCKNPVFGSHSTPDTGFGFQYPRSGENMAGIFPFVKHEEYREYIQCQLTQPLIKGNYYHFSMYLNNSVTNSYASTTSCMQVYFSDFDITQPTSYLPLPVLPQIKNDPLNFYQDTANWILFEGNYKAVGNEGFMTIGCFDNDAEISISNVITDTTGTDIYFYIDDVQLLEIPSSSYFPNIFSPNNDNINDYYIPSIVNIPDWEVIITNRWGNIVTILNDDTPFWDGKTGKDWAEDGVYFYRLNSSDKTFNESGFIQLIR